MPLSRAGIHLAAALLAGLSAASCGDDGAKPPAAPGGAPAAKGIDPSAAARLVALENRGIALLERYDYGAAEAALREAHGLAPDWIPGRVHLALALIHRGAESRPEAQTILEGVLRDDPRHAHATFLAAWTAETAGDTARALELWRRAYELTGRDPVAGASLGALLAGVDGREREALAVLKEVHEREPALISPVNQIQLLLRQLGEEAEAERYYAKLMALNGRVREGMDQTKVGRSVRQAYGNMGPFSMAMRDFGDPGGAAGAGTADAALQGSVAARPSWTAGDLPPRAPYLGAAALDYDADGDVDLFVCGGTGPSALLRNDGGELTDVAKEAGVAVVGAFAVAAGEVDVEPSRSAGSPPGRRARVDLVVLRDGGLTLLRNRGDGTFEDATAASGLAADTGEARAALLWDADQDGDLDLFLSGEAGARNRLWANRGPGVFVDATADSGLAGDGGAYGPAAVVDVDEDYDHDLVVSRPAAGPAVFANDRLLKFREAAAPPTDQPSPHGILAADLDADGHEDVLVPGEASSTLLRGTGRSFEARAFASRGGPAIAVDPRSSGALTVVFSDGTWRSVRPEGAGAVGAGKFAGGTPADDPAASPVRLANLVAVDLDGDGREDVVRVVPGRPPVVWRWEGERGNAVTLDLEGVIRNDVQAGWSNLEGRGAVVEVKAGALWQQRRVGNPSGYGCSSPARLVCGVGTARQADFVRILWPDAVQQAVLDVPAGPPQVLLEEQRRPDSCPLLFAWDGERWAFVTDFLGVGGVGFLVAPGVYGPPDPTESVKIEGSLVKPRDDGRVVLKMLESMEEVCYVDACDLVAVDHPADVAVFPDERFAGERPFPDGRLLAHRGEILPVAARDASGRDVLDRVVAIDRRYPDAFRLHARLTGATEEAVLDLDFGDRLAGVAPGDPVVLHAHGWIEYGYTRTSVAAAGEGFEYRVPSLEAWDAASATWRTVVANLGYPAGFPRVMTYDLTGLVSRETPRLRIRTNFEVYWDKVWLARALDLAAAPVRTTVLAAESADLRWVGYPREHSPDGRVPRIYDYGTLDPSMPWKTVAGDYTKFGPVTPLVASADDMYVVFGKGEEIELRFDARALPELPAGWTRSWVLRTTGWCKGQELYTAHGWTVEPLPFLGMSHYPYREDEHYPDDDAHRAYRRTWNTRRVAVPESTHDAGTR